MWVRKKGNEYGTLTQRSPERPLVEFWGLVSPSHWKAQRPFDGVFLLLLSLAWCACDSPNGGPEVLKMRSPSSPGWRTSVTYDSEEKLFFVVGLAPCLGDRASSCRFWAEQRSDGKGRWVDASRQPSGGGQIFSHATWGRGSRPPPPATACLLATESGHVSILLPVLLRTLYSGSRISFLG